jgi:hypothetical protein
MLKLLFEQRFEEYFAAFRRQDPLWVFVHVPKTAGSSLRGELAQVLKPEANIFVDYNDPSKTYMESLDAAVAAFIRRNATARHRFASGHIFAQHVESIAAAAPPTRRITMLRQPVKRVISDYRYQGSPMHPGNREFRDRFPSFMDYLKQDEECNKATRYLVPYEIFRRGDAKACTDYIVEKFDFVGLQEMYPLAFRLLFALIGERRFPTLRVRVNEGGEDADLASDPAIIAEAEKRNELDMAVHRALLELWKPVRDPALEYLSRLALPQEMPA